MTKTNETILKFGYPETLVREYRHWVVLIRPAQVTVGSLVLACREKAARFPELSREAFAELREATGHMEDALSSAFAYDKINYLMLMMVDRHVHYHVIPRYSEPVSLAGRSYPDEFWPGPPDITHAIDLPEDALAAIRNKVRVAWPS